MRSLRFLAVWGCLGALASAQTDAGLWRFVHPNAKALIGIDVQRIRTSRVAGEMSSQMHSMPLPMGFPMMIPGMDMLKSIERVIVSSPGKDEGHPDREPPILIAIGGTFEPGKLGQMFTKSGAKKQTFDAVTVYRPQDKNNSDFAFAVLNSQTMLVGDAKSIFEVIERANKGALNPPPIVDRARDMDAAYDFWAILSTTPAAMASDRIAFMNFSGKLNGFDAGIAVRDGLVVDVKLDATSEKAAKEIADQLTKLIKLSAQDRENHPEFLGLDKKVRMKVDHSDVHFSLRLDAKEVARLAQSIEQTRRKGQAVSAQANVPVIVPGKPLITVKPPEQRRQTIKIDGLDDGPKEIPYHPNR